MGIFLDCLEIFSDQCWTRNAEALLVWKEQCSPLWVGKVRSLFRMLAYFKDRQTWRIKGVLLHLMGFPNFSMDDLERMNDDTRWLSDMHICFALQWVAILFYISNMNGFKDCLWDCSKRDLWHGRKIQLLDTLFWPLIVSNLESFRDRYRAKLNLIECEYVVIPMFSS